MTSTVAVSAPGKVLLAGGYLVLDRGYTGLVFGLDARIHVFVQDLATRDDDAAPFEVVVRSPQFKDAEWRYECQETEDDGGIEVIQLKSHSLISQSRNKFVETSLAYALTYISALAHSSIASASVTILADTDYYSNTGSPSNATITTNRRFPDFNVPLQEAHKTGLGSSAALVTAFTAALLVHYLSADLLSLTSEAGKACVHNLAQAAHCAAQGKVGSGFDVAAAVYGSCIYRRFSPSILENLAEVGTKGFSARLKSVIENTDHSQDWDMEIDKSGAVLPTGLRLVMCDVDCGSETVGMVKRVLSWKKGNPEEAALLWRTLQKGNEDLAEELRSLAREPTLSSSNFENLGAIFLTIRSLVREMSTKTGVPIEPKVQTQLLDACCQISGVVGGVVPGAGGFDAIALLIENKQEIYDALHNVLDKYTVDAEQGDGASIGQVRLLGVQQEMQGAKVEDPIIYEGWVR